MGQWSSGRWWSGSCDTGVEQWKAVVWELCGTAVEGGEVGSCVQRERGGGAVEWWSKAVGLGEGGWGMGGSTQKGCLGKSNDILLVWKGSSPIPTPFTPNPLACTWQTAT